MLRGISRCMIACMQRAGRLKGKRKSLHSRPYYFCFPAATNNFQINTIGRPIVHIRSVPRHPILFMRFPSFAAYFVAGRLKSCTECNYGESAKHASDHKSALENDSSGDSWRGENDHNSMPILSQYPHVGIFFISSFISRIACFTALMDSFRDL